ncbi:hypothetical protein D3C78_608730 [compost metagenome]
MRAFFVFGVFRACLVPVKAGAWPATVASVVAGFRRICRSSLPLTATTSLLLLDLRQHPVAVLDPPRHRARSQLHRLPLVTQSAPVYVDETESL